MTNEELARLRETATLSAMQVVLETLFEGLGTAQSLRESLERCASELRRRGSGHTIPGESADLSMLLSGETEEVYARLAAEIEQRVLSNQAK